MVIFELLLPAFLWMMVLAVLLYFSLESMAGIGIAQNWQKQLNEAHLKEAGHASCHWGSSDHRQWRSSEVTETFYPKLQLSFDFDQGLLPRRLFGGNSKACLRHPVPKGGVPPTFQPQKNTSYFNNFYK